MGQGSSGFQSPIMTSSSQSAGPIQRGGGSHVGRWLLIGCGGFILLVVLGFAGLFGFIFAAFRNSDVVQTAVRTAAADTRVTAALGTPLKVGWMISGAINEENGGGNAKLTVPINGPNGSGTLYVEATRESKKWTYQTLDAELPGQGGRIHLVKPQDLVPGPVQ